MSDSSAPESGETRNLVFERVFDAPVDRVWKAWTDPEDVKAWWGPQGFSCPVAKLDVREGGASLVAMRAPAEFGGQDTYNTWTYRRVEPLKELEYLAEFADEKGNKLDPSALNLPPGMPAETLFRVTFQDLGDGRTALNVTEFDWPVGQMMEMSKMGMESSLDKMEALFADA